MNTVLEYMILGAIAGLLNEICYSRVSDVKNSRTILSALKNRAFRSVFLRCPRTTKPCGCVHLNGWDEWCDAHNPDQTECLRPPSATGHSGPCAARLVVTHAGLEEAADQADGTSAADRTCGCHGDGCNDCW